MSGPPTAQKRKVGLLVAVRPAELIGGVVRITLLHRRGTFHVAIVDADAQDEQGRMGKACAHLAPRDHADAGCCLQDVAR